MSSQIVSHFTKQTIKLCRNYNHLIHGRLAKGKLRSATTAAFAAAPATAATATAASGGHDSFF